MHAAAKRPTLVIGNKHYSSWSLRPWLLLRARGVDFEEIVVPLDTPEFHARIATLSPSRRVPALLHDGVTVWDSLAICEYADEHFLERTGWPSERAARATARSLACEMHSGFQALRTECPMNVLRRLEKPMPVSAAAAADIARIEAMWADARERFGQGGDFLFGAFGIVDAFFAPVVTRLDTYAQPVSAATRRYMDAVFALPAMQQWIAGAKAETHVLEKYERIG
jgi:glutathione S-transferase